jgi:hypothetical protein
MTLDIYSAVDDVDGETRIDVWTNGVGDLHISISDPHALPASVYIRNGEELAKAILKAVW